MAYTIAFELDYDSNPYQEVREIRTHLRAALLRAGFRPDGRRFTINRSSNEAGRLARQTLDDLAQQLRPQGRSLYLYIRDFYGYPATCADNLLLPPPGAIGVHSRVGADEHAPNIASFRLHCASSA